MSNEVAVKQDNNQSITSVIQTIELAACNESVNVEKMQALLDMQERILDNMHPNANAWHGCNQRVTDDEVARIKLSRTLPWNDKEWKDPRKT